MNFLSSCSFVFNNFWKIRANTNEHQCSLYMCSCSFIPAWGCEMNFMIQLLCELTLNHLNTVLNNKSGYFWSGPHLKSFGPNALDFGKTRMTETNGLDRNDRKKRQNHDKVTTSRYIRTTCLSVNLINLKNIIKIWAGFHKSVNWKDHSRFQ